MCGLERRIAGNPWTKRARQREGASVLAEFEHEVMLEREWIAPRSPRVSRLRSTRDGSDGTRPVALLPRACRFVLDAGSSAVREEQPRASVDTFVAPFVGVRRASISRELT